MKRVLLVEDEASIREMVALNLKMAGWEVVEAPSAERALELMHGGDHGYKAISGIFRALYPVFPDRADTDTDHGAWRFVLCADTVS